MLAQMIRKERSVGVKPQVPTIYEVRVIAHIARLSWPPLLTQ